MKNAFSKILVLLLLVTLMVTACAPKATPAPTVEATIVLTEAPVVETEPTEEVLAPLDPVEKVTVAYVPIMKFAAVYVAKEGGYFEKQGLDVELISVKSGTEAIAFLGEGTVDVGGIAIVVSLWNGWASDLDLRIIAPGALEPFENSPTIFLVRKDLVDDGSVKTVADLKGKTVAVAGGPGSGGEYLAAKALERGGLSIFDVSLQNIGNADIPAAFENKSIDAGLLGSPYAEQIIESGFAVALEKDLTPGLMTVAFVGSDRFINERTEVAQRFVLALMEASRSMQGEGYFSDENIAAYMAYVATTPEDIKKGTPVIYDPNLTTEIEGLADVERVHRENGRLEYTEPIDMSKVVNSTFIEWALAQLDN